MQQRQMTTHSIKKQQMTPQKMTISTPQNDSRHFMIPAGTIVQEERKAFNLPFRYLRTWIFSLLALIALPIGIGLVLVGQSVADAGGRAWQETTATVTRATDDRREFVWESDGKEYNEEVSFNLMDYAVGTPDGIFTLSYDLCDLVGIVVVPAERDGTFPVWVNPSNARDVSCVPMDNETGGLIITIGSILIIFSGLRLLATINGAALRPAR